MPGLCVYCMRLWDIFVAGQVAVGGIQWRVNFIVFMVNFWTDSGESLGYMWVIYGVEMELIWITRGEQQSEDCGIVGTTELLGARQVSRSAFLRKTYVSHGPGDYIFKLADVYIIFRTAFVLNTESFTRAQTSSLSLSHSL